MTDPAVSKTHYPATGLVCADIEEACRRAQVAAARLAHIGDEPGTDLAGAQNAKVTGIWMNRRGQTADPVIAHHAEIRNMTELLSLLGAD